MSLMAGTWVRGILCIRPRGSFQTLLGEIDQEFDERGLSEIRKLFED